VGEKEKVVAIRINYDYCKRCGICSAFCNREVFTTDEFERPVAEKLAECTNCKLCVLRCPDFAIRLEVSASA
jgi:2-oxoglutarate ferredoxin oxidoreductase subunit delta